MPVITRKSMELEERVFSKFSDGSEVLGWVRLQNRTTQKIMDFIDQIKAISQQIQKLKEQILTEEATKSAFVMPFINALGYNVFNPIEVCPEFIADLPNKNAETIV